jgi:probable phosphoglycerate mutase
MTLIGFIRHGITDWIIEGRSQGQTDVPLNQIGRKQAHALADRLMDEEWDMIYSSDLSQAKETAQIIGNTLELSVQTDQRLRERYCGEIEGTTLADRISRWGNEWKSLPLGVEDDESIIARGVSFASYIKERYPDKKVLIVSHGILGRLTLKRLMPHLDTDEHLDNTSITKIRYTSDKWECELFNCTIHIL